MGSADPIIAVSDVSVLQSRDRLVGQTVAEKEPRHGGDRDQEHEIRRDFVLILRADKILVLIVSPMCHRLN